MFLKPSYFIIGERKCGTSSLFRYLIKHPNVLPGRLKEPNFFGKGPDYVQNNIEEYWSLFPSLENKGDLSFEWPELNAEGILYHEKVDVPRDSNLQYITGEASVNTFYEVAPELLYQFLPDLKLILLIREPTARAFSHHRMYKRFMEEGRSGFDVSDFADDCRKEMAAILNGGTGEFLSPGIYLRQLRKWLAVYPKDQLRVFTAAELDQSPDIVLKELMDYLNLPDYDYGDFLGRRFNQAPKVSMDPVIQKELSDFYQPFNEALSEFLGKELNW